MANAELDELHRSMGEFLTSCAHLENMLLGLLIICDSDTTAFQDIAKQFLPLTFGARVDLLVKKCSAKQFSPDHRAILDKEFGRLKVAIEKRNLIVHGTTHEVGFGASEGSKPYRIGAQKGNLGYMQQFFELKGDVAHSFTADQVRAAGALCDDIRGGIGKVVADVMTEKAQKK
jgi:hypothetical protein